MPAPTSATPFTRRYPRYTGPFRLNLIIALLLALVRINWAPMIRLYRLPVEEVYFMWNRDILPNILRGRMWAIRAGQSTAKRRLVACCAVWGATLRTSGWVAAVATAVTRQQHTAEQIDHIWRTEIKPRLLAGDPIDVDP